MFRPAEITRYRLTTLRQVASPRLRIAVFADLHASAPFMDLSRIESLVAQTNALGADLILLLGDYVGHLLGGRDLAPGPVAARLGKLTAPRGVFAVFGNHDWRDDSKAQATGRPTHWHDALRDAGITTLSNEAVELDTDGGRISLAGLESQRALQTFWKREARGFDDLDAVLSQVDPDSFTILMAHEPDVFPDLPGHIDLTLSGHTHGGQIAPFGRPLVVPSRYGRRYAYGHHRDDSKQMVVSGGLGCSGLPLRIGRPPELTLVELT